MEKTFWKRAKISLLTLSMFGLLAACNTTDDFEENPQMGGDEAPVEDPADPAEEAPTGGGDAGEEGETTDN